MLIPDNIHPEKSIYYNGSFVLQALQTQKRQSLMDLYQNVRQLRTMTFPVFVLCLDWLFLINVAVLDSDGEVQLCS